VLVGFGHQQPDQAHALRRQRRPKLAPEDLTDRLHGRNQAAEHGQLVQHLVVAGIDHRTAYRAFQFQYIAEEPGDRIGVAGDRDLDPEVVAVDPLAGPE
jgi:hypothetical protein